MNKWMDETHPHTFSATQIGVLDVDEYIIRFVFSFRETGEQIKRWSLGSKQAHTDCQMRR